VIHIERCGAVTVVVLDRPERRNALDHDHCEQLATIVRAAPDGGARALVLAGAGPHFCSGADLTGVEDAAFVGTLHEALEALATVPVPTIAAVHGAVLGAGSQLAIACDLRVAEPSARFAIPAAKLGLMVDHWTIARLALLAGHGPARAMLIAAEEYDAQAAHALGLVQRLGDRASALGWAEELTTLAPLTMAGHKLGLNLLEAGLGPPAGDGARGGPGGDGAYDTAFHAAWSSRDLAEAMAARAERRSPRFEGR